MDKKWALPLGLALVALLILWGSLGMGTASKLFPEKTKAMPPVTGADQTASEGASSSSMLPQEESRRVYDASSYIRGKPLADPFHMEAMTEKAMPVETAGVSLPSSAPCTANSSAGSAKEKRSYASDVPRLMGVMSFGSEKRAVIEVHGVTYTVKEGEQAGLWNVSSIQGKTVTLAGASGIFTLSTR